MKFKTIIGFLSLVMLIIFAGNIFAFGGNTGMTSNLWKLVSGTIKPIGDKPVEISTLQISGSINPGPLVIATSTSPEIRFAGDTNTGIGWEADDELGFYTGGTERITIDNAGKVGVLGKSRFTATSTFATAIQLGDTTQDNMFFMKPTRTYETSVSKNGAFNINNTLNNRAAVNIYSNNTGNTQSEALMELNVVASDFGNSLLVIDSDAVSSDGDIKILSYASEIEFVDKNYSPYTHGDGKFEIQNKYNKFRFNSRNWEDNGFEEIMSLQRVANGGQMGLNDISPDAHFEIARSATSTVQDIINLSSASGEDGDLMTISYDGAMVLGGGDGNGWKTATSSLGYIHINSNALSPSSIDLSNSYAVGTGTGGANATNKYLGQYGWITRDSSLSSPKMVAYISAEATETYAADVDVGSKITFWTGTDNNTNPTQKMSIDNDGDLNVVGGIKAGSYTSDPCGSLAEGMLWYNNTSDYYCFCDGAGVDKKVSDNGACF